jgi:hypothetical protein
MGLAVLAAVSAAPACRKIKQPSRSEPPPGARPAPAAGPTVIGWGRVIRDAPLLRGPDVKLSDISGTLAAGRLVERLQPQRLPPNKRKFIDKAQTFEVAGQSWTTTLAEIQVHAGEPRWMPSVALDAQVSDVPSRQALCALLAERKLAQRPDCLKHGQFFRPDDAQGKPARLLAVYAESVAERINLAIVDVGGGGASQPRVVGVAPVGALFGLHHEPLPGGKTLLIAREYLRRGDLTGEQLALFSLDASGALDRQHEVPVQSSEPRDGSVTQRTAAVTFDRAEGGLLVRVKGTETVQVIRTGKIRSRKPFEHAIRWDTAQQRFAAADRPTRRRTTR